MRKVTCPRCKGHKYILGQEVQTNERSSNLPNYKKVKKGVCFLCDGLGYARLREKDNVIIKIKDEVTLKYSNINGRYLGIEEPTFEPVEERFSLGFNLTSNSIVDENTKRLIDEENEYLELLHESMCEEEELLFEQMRKENEEFGQKNIIKSSSYDTNYISISELEDMCNLPEGVGLFDDDR